MIKHQMTVQIGRLLTFSILSGITSPVWGATVVSAPPFAYITGTIEASDTATVAALLRSPRDAVIIRINSDGGSVEAAMAIGRLLRKAGKIVAVEAGDRCASACVFILAAAVERVVEGEVVIHRPYLTEDLPDGIGYDEQYKRTEKLIGSYLADMNIPAALGERMLAIPPDEGEVLTAVELDRYMLNGKDPAYEQQEAAEEAKRLGIPFVEQRRRQVSQKTVCSWSWSRDPDLFEEISHNDCKIAIMRGYDPRIVQNRVRVLLQKRGTIIGLPEKVQDSCVGKFILGTAPAGDECPLK